jgi:hypothetical protein
MPLFSYVAAYLFSFFKVAKKRYTHTREACGLSAIPTFSFNFNLCGVLSRPGLFVGVKVDRWHSRKIYVKADPMSRPIFLKFKLPKYSFDIYVSIR